MHFSIIEIKTKCPLELVHTDFWGPSLVLSIDGYRYYIFFIDDFTRYYWIFPLVLKSDALTTFKNFKCLVEKQFNLSIKALQSDIRGEFKGFQSFLKQQGIQTRFSYPHTHHQNGVVKRNHRHIVETGLTFLTQAKMPFFFFCGRLFIQPLISSTECQPPFSTAYFLIKNFITSHQITNFLEYLDMLVTLFSGLYNQHKLDFH